MTRALPDGARVRGGRPCPWCGAYPDVRTVDVDGEKFRRVGCSDEHCYVNPGAVADTTKRAVAAWNDRYGD